MPLSPAACWRNSSSQSLRSDMNARDIMKALDQVSEGVEMGSVGTSLFFQHNYQLGFICSLALNGSECWIQTDATAQQQEPYCDVQKSLLMSWVQFFFLLLILWKCPGEQTIGPSPTHCYNVINRPMKFKTHWYIASGLVQNRPKVTQLSNDAMTVSWGILHILRCILNVLNISTLLKNCVVLAFFILYFFPNRIFRLVNHHY